MKKLVYYISGHGLGHAVRSIEVIKALKVEASGLEIMIRTTLGPVFFQSNLPFSPEIITLSQDRALDLGLVQIDNLRHDLPATLERIKRILARADEVIYLEKKALQDFGADAVAADIPFLAFPAAREAGIPSTAVGNFTWDWIYDYYGRLDPAWREAARRIRDYYRLADQAVELPLSHDLGAVFNRVARVGLTGRMPDIPREKVRKMLNVPPDSGLILFAFSGLDISRESLDRIARENPNHLFLFSGPLELSGPSFINADSTAAGYPDLIGASDIVLTKPGYGITADCLHQNAAMVYTDRGAFPEYPILVRAIEDYLYSKYIPSEDLYAGRLKGYLENLEPPQAGQPPWPRDGAQKTARIILEAG